MTRRATAISRSRLRRAASGAVPAVLVLAGLSTVTGTAPVAVAAVPQPSSPPTVFAYTGAPQQYTVPTNVDTLFVQVVGGAGGTGQFAAEQDATALGGSGGQVVVQLAVTPGESLQINVGGAGQDGPSSVNGDPQRGQGLFHVAQGGWNGGGAAGFSTYTWGGSYASPQVGNVAGGGGGATDIRACFSPQNTICPVADRIVVAGGGGGAGMDNGLDSTNANGGAGGILADGSGAPGQVNPLTSVPTNWPVGATNAAAGQGGTALAGGAGGAATSLEPSDYEGAEYCATGPSGGAGLPGTTSGTGGAGGSGHYSVQGSWSTTIGGGGGGGGYTGGGGGGCGGFLWSNVQNGTETAAFDGAGSGGGGSSWVDPTRVAESTPDPIFSIASLRHLDGYVVVQGVQLGSTGAHQAVPVPVNASAVNYALSGAQGGAYGLAPTGGAGASVTGTLAAPGPVLQVDVGGGGQVTNCNEPGCAMSSFGGPPQFDPVGGAYVAGTFALQQGWNGGGEAVPTSYLTSADYWGFGYEQAGGGGATGLAPCPAGASVSTALAGSCGSAAVVAAGGGGASIVDVWESSVSGGQGGCEVGQEPSDDTDGGAGRGGTQTAGGVGGGSGPSGSTGGQAGTAGQGGDGGLGDTEIDQSRQGAGGGGGLFGGGGGGGGGSEGDTFFHSPGAGGGGSSLVPDGATCSQGSGPAIQGGYDSADGVATVSFPVLVPGQPDALHATDVTGDPTSVDLAWDTTGAFGSAITGGLVQTSDDAGQTWSTPVATATTTSTTVTGLDPSTSYVFRVQLQNSSGTGPVSAASNAVHVPVLAPDQVTGVTAGAAPDAVAVRWSAPYDNGAPVTGYLVRTSADGGQTWATPVAVPAPSTSYVAGNLTSAAEYLVQVAAANRAGTGPWSTSTAPVTPVGIPSAPGTPAADAALFEIDLSWAGSHIAGAPVNGQSVTGYQVRATDTTTDDQIIVDTDSDATTFSVSSLVAGHPYRFAVRALNGDVPGPWSGVSAPVAADGIANAPGRARAIAANTRAGLTWQVPTSLAGGVVVGYRIEKVAPQTSRRWSVAVVSTGSATTSATVTGLTNGIGYRFRIAAQTTVPDGHGGELTVLGDWSSPTSTVMPRPNPDPGPSPSPSPLPTPPPAPTPSPSPRPAPDPGTAVVTVDGAGVPVTVAALPAVRPVTSRITAGAVAVDVVAFDVLGRPAGLGAGGVVAVRTSAVGALPASVRLQVAGIAPDDRPTAVLTPGAGDPVALEPSWRRVGDSYVAQPVLPSGMPAGPATLTLTAARSDGARLAFAIGVRIAPAGVRHGVQSMAVFTPLHRGGPLAKGTVRGLTRLASDAGMRAGRARLVAALPMDLRPAERRAVVAGWERQITKALRDAGFDGTLRTTARRVPGLLGATVTLTLLHRSR